MARQIGAAWHDLRQWRSRIESEVRGTFPNLPPTHEVAQAVRSPLAFLDRLADEHERALSDEDRRHRRASEPRRDGGTDAVGPAPPAAGRRASGDRHRSIGQRVGPGARRIGAAHNGSGDGRVAVAGGRTPSAERAGTVGARCASRPCPTTPA